MAYHNRSILKYALGKKEDAIADYDLAIQLDPNDAAAYHNRCTIKSALDDKKSAIQDYQKAADLYKQQGNTLRSQLAVDNMKNYPNSSDKLRIIMPSDDSPTPEKYP